MNTLNTSLCTVAGHVDADTHAAVVAQRDALLEAARKTLDATRFQGTFEEFDTLFDSVTAGLRAAVAAVPKPAPLAIPAEAAAVGASLDPESLDQGEPA